VTTSNPYGTRPGGGISLPDEYRPTPSVINRNAYFGGREHLPPGEMRISFLGSTPWPPTLSQSGTSMLVELGSERPHPRRFFFDLGNGSVKNAISLQVPPFLINDIFISHLHSDHYADLPYSYPFTAWSGRWEPLRLYGPSGRTPELGIKHMAKHMREMQRWHEENFDHTPIGDGFEIAGFRPATQGVEVEPRPFEDLPCGVLRDPGLDRHASRVAVFALQAELRPSPAVSDRLPTIGRRLRLVHDQRGVGTLSGGLLVLVGPPSVVGHGVARKDGQSWVA